MPLSELWDPAHISRDPGTIWGTMSLVIGTQSLDLAMGSTAACEPAPASLVRSPGVPGKR